MCGMGMLVLQRGLPEVSCGLFLADMLTGMMDRHTDFAAFAACGESAGPDGLVVESLIAHRIYGASVVPAPRPDADAATADPTMKGMTRG